MRNPMNNEEPSLGLLVLAITVFVLLLLVVVTFSLEDKDLENRLDRLESQVHSLTTK